MIVCHCAVVSDRDIKASIEDGARCLIEVCEATGAGQTCGGCTFSIKRLLCQDGAVNAAPLVLEVAGAAG